MYYSSTDSSDKDIGGIWYAQGTDTMQFRASNDVRMSIDGSGTSGKPNQLRHFNIWRCKC